MEKKNFLFMVNKAEYQVSPTNAEGNTPNSKINRELH